MRSTYAATAALSTVVSAVLLGPAAVATASPTTVVPPVHQAQRTGLAPEYTEIVRDGITLLHHRRPVPARRVTGRGVTRSDFDGDGRDDVAGSFGDGVMVRYSSAPHRDHLRTELPMGGGNFGMRLVTGNFNGDRYDDLAVADGNEPDLRGMGYHAGAVWVFAGGPGGLQVNAVKRFSQNTPGVPGVSAANDQFGSAMAAGDLNGDRRDDLAIGIPMKKVGAAREAGAVLVLKGSAAGLVARGAQWLTQNTAGVPGSAERGDGFGVSLAIGTVNRNRYQELIVGAPREDEGNLNSGSGVVTQFWGGPAGVSLKKVTAVSGEAATRAANNDHTWLWNFGGALAVTDTTGDGYGEVIVGDPGGQVGNNVAPGAVVSLAGRATGLSAKGLLVLSQDSKGVADTTEDDDHFGAALAVGDVTGDGLGDVLVGVPDEDVGRLPNAGAVVLLRGSRKGLTGVRSVTMTQNSRNVPDLVERSDWFGNAVVLLNLNGSGGLDALVGTPGELNAGDRSGYPSGSVTSFPGGPGGFGLGSTTTGRSIGYGTELGAGYGGSLAGPQA